MFQREYNDKTREISFRELDPKICTKILFLTIVGAGVFRKIDHKIMYSFINS